MQRRRRERFTVVRDDGDEELEVYNWINFQRLEKWVVWGHGMAECFNEGPEIGAGDSSMTPEAVTQWLADELAREHNINVTKLGIEVIDVESDEVDVL